MGLDLMMWKKKDFDAMAKGELKWAEDIELAYGRKTWAIEKWFADRSGVIEEDYLFDVPESAWDEFYNIFNPCKDELSKKVDRYFELIEKPINSVTEEEVHEYDTLYNEINDLMEGLFEGSYFQLGPDWEASALIRWIDAYPKVKEAYKEGPVYMEASW